MTVKVVVCVMDVSNAGAAVAVFAWDDRPAMTGVA